MCAQIRSHFDALTARLVKEQDVVPDFNGLKSCVPPEQMAELLERFKPILIIASAHTEG